MENFQFISPITTISAATIGASHSKPRVWLEGGKLERANFPVKRGYTVVPNILDRSLTIKGCDTEPMPRHVAKKSTPRGQRPVIDINNDQLRKIVGHHKLVKIVYRDSLIEISIHPKSLEIEERANRLKAAIEAGEPILTGSLAHGAGVLDHAIHQGLASAGLSSKLSFANDMQLEFLEVASNNNPIWSKNTLAYAARIEDLIVSDLPKIHFLIAGIPCTGASNSGKSKNKIKFAEEHETAGQFFHHFLNVVKGSQPAVVLVENVVPFKNTAGYVCIRNTLEDMGYIVHETTLAGNDHGALENRVRFCMVAATKGIDVSLKEITPIAEKPACLGDILEEVSEDAFATKPHLDEKAIRDAENGKGFALNRVTAQSTKIGVTGEGYQRARSTEPMLMHPDEPNKVRLLTPKEMAAAMTVPFKLIADCSDALAYRLCGQSVTHNAFVAIGKKLGTDLKQHEKRSQHPDAGPLFAACV